MVAWVKGSEVEMVYSNQSQEVLKIESTRINDRSIVNEEKKQYGA